jgi:hypothetical protein
MTNPLTGLIEYPRAWVIKSGTGMLPAKNRLFILSAAVQTDTLLNALR